MEGTNGKGACQASTSSDHDMQDLPYEYLQAADSSKLSSVPLYRRGDPSTGTSQAGREKNSSLSEMDLDEPLLPTRDTPEPPSSKEPPLLPAMSLLLKRKLSQTMDTDSENTDIASVATNKRSKLDNVVENLPVGVWQQVFLYLSPAMLCRCLRVSWKFKRALTETQKSTPGGSTGFPLLDSETIWSVSRRSYTDLPRPLSGLSELKMLQLISGSGCQKCNHPTVRQLPIRPWTCGPGRIGERVVWPFKLRLCGRCLDYGTLKVWDEICHKYRSNEFQDTQVLVDSSVASLRSGLPHGYRTPDMHFISESVRKQQRHIPTHVHALKVYWWEDTKAIKREYQDAVRLGGGAAEEWLKGLTEKGKEAMVNSARWEEWEIKVGFGTDFASILREYDTSSFPRTVKEAENRSSMSSALQPCTVNNWKHPLPKPVFSSTFQQKLSLPEAPTTLPHHPVRSRLEAEEARRARVSDIERRCMALDPPISRTVLEHMASFQAAKKITSPMTESAWQLLKCRLLAQREQAEHDEYLQSNELSADNTTTTEITSEMGILALEDTSQWVKWHATQKTLQNELDRIAAECVSNELLAEGLFKKNAPDFAIRVLLSVKDCFQRQKQTGCLAKTPTEMLFSISAMRWVYDRHVHPLTEKFYRNIFLCAGCEKAQNDPHWFVFEGLLAHYEAKHFNEYNLHNNSKSHAFTPWPEEPFFHIEPFKWLNRLALEGTITATVKNNISSRRHSEENTLAKIVRDIWDKLKDVQDLMKCIRLQATIHGAFKAFQTIHLRCPTLDNFAEILSSNAAMEPLRRSKELACAECLSCLNLETNITYFARVEYVPSMNLQDLIAHWKVYHPSMAHVDWSKGMIEVPLSQLQDLANSPGMDDEKLKILAETFPSSFPDPLPSLESMVPSSDTPKSRRDDLVSRVIHQATKLRTKSGSKKKKRSRDNRGLSQVQQQTEDSPDPDENEYDPHRPIFPSLQPDDRKSELGGMNEPKSSINTSVEAQSDEKLSDILAALNSHDNDSIMTAKRESITPSTSVSNSDIAVVRHTPENAASVQPDFGAILASVIALQSREVGASSVADNNPKNNINQAGYSVQPPYDQPLSNISISNRLLPEINRPSAKPSAQAITTQEGETSLRADLEKTSRPLERKYCINFEEMMDDHYVDSVRQPYARIDNSAHQINSATAQSSTSRIYRESSIRYSRHVPERAILVSNPSANHAPKREIWRDVNGNEFEVVVKNQPILPAPPSWVERPTSTESSRSYNLQHPHIHGYLQTASQSQMAPAYPMHESAQLFEFQRPPPTPAHYSPRAYEHFRSHESHPSTHTTVRVLTSPHDQNLLSRETSKQSVSNQEHYYQPTSASGDSLHYGHYPA